VVWKVREVAWVGRELRERARRAGERWRDAMVGGGSCMGIVRDGGVRSRL